MGSKLMWMGRVWSMLWIMEVFACLLGFHFSFLLHHSCKFVVLSRLIYLHRHGFVVKEEIGLKVSGASGDQCYECSRSKNQYLAEQLWSNEGWRLSGRLMG